MTIPFTYLIVHKTTNKAYYGVRYAQGCDPVDLWTTYFTSSNRVKKLIETYGKDSFDVQVRKTFVDNISAVAWEQKVLSKLDLKNGIWLNTMVNTNLFIVTSETMKENWKHQSYIDAQIYSQTVAWSNTELRQVHSHIMKSKWTDERRTKASEATTMQWKNTDRIVVGKKISQTRIDRNIKPVGYERTDDIRLKMSLSAKRKKKITCSCGKTVDVSNYGRWHKNCPLFFTIL